MRRPLRAVGGLRGGCGRCGWHKVCKAVPAPEGADQLVAGEVRAIMVNDLDYAGESNRAAVCAGRLPGGKPGMLLSMAVGWGLGLSIGMLLGKKKGEARGLALGLELGRTEAVASLAAPPTWRR